jgi:hypothetical protein
MTTSTRLPVTLIVWIALILTLIVWVIRISSAVTLDRPFLAGTSGCEEEALFSVWKTAKGYGAYSDPWLPHFSQSYFGWLFYKVYGLWCFAGLAAFSLPDAWLPTIARLLTLIATVGCIVVYTGLLRSGAPLRERFSTPILAAFATLVVVNPLFHWWSFTTRPDIAALLFELSALAVGFTYTKTHRFSSLLWFALLAFLAWSFRPTNISVLVGMGFFLLLVGRWKHLAALVALMATAFAAVFLLLGSNFYQSVIVANALSGPPILSVGWSNWMNAITKDPIVLLGAIGLLPVALACNRWRHDEKTLLSVLCGAVSLGMVAVFACKSGAGSNYYFPPAAFLPLAFLLAASHFERPGLWLKLFVGLSAASIVLCSVLILSGRAGNLRMASDQRLHDLVSLRPELSDPIFCTDRAANLPWILGDGVDSPVFGFAYRNMLQASPEKFAGGTIADLLQQGRYATVVISEEGASYMPEPEELQGYQPAKSIPGFQILVRNP